MNKLMGPSRLHQPVFGRAVSEIVDQCLKHAGRSRIEHGFAPGDLDHSHVRIKFKRAHPKFRALNNIVHQPLTLHSTIAAYKSLEVVRLLKKAGHQVTPVLTKGGEHFVTAMSLGTLAQSQVHTSLWELKDEVEIGHIQLSRSADFILVCPATADLLAKMAAGIADDLATTLLLATDKPVVAAPAMNVRMWQHAATQRNVAQLKADGVRVIEPAEGDMACGEFGPGRLPEPQDIVDQLADLLK